MAVSSSTNGADTPFADITHFRSLIGALQYLAITRPDIQFAVNRVAQRMHQPSEHDYHCLKRILRYIFSTLSRGLLIRLGDFELRGFSDSDWANDKNDRKSTSGFLGLTRKLKDLSKVFDEFLERIINEHVEYHDRDQTKDFVDTMMDIMQSGEAEFQFDHRHIKAILLDMLLAAMDTTASTAEWILTELLRHP
uniref:Cytochrome P450 n=1 Tax=Solanum lycopersicum TaxID=4081 RepID=A0A3Q7GX25_SOLLC